MSFFHESNVWVMEAISLGVNVVSDGSPGGIASRGFDRGVGGGHGDVRVSMMVAIGTRVSAAVVIVVALVSSSFIILILIVAIQMP